MKAEGLWRVAGQELKLTNLDKVLFPPRDGVDEPALTKRDLIAYFARIAPAMLPHLADRPLNLQRFPNGADGARLLAEGHPVVGAQVAHDLARDRLPRARGPGGQRPPRRRPGGDAVLARQPGLVRDPRLDVHHSSEPWTPTFALIDIDPGTKTTWEETLVLARLYRTALEHLGVRAYPKLTGSRGIQAWIPVERGRYEYADTSAWVEKLSRAIGGDGARPRVVGVGEGRPRRQGAPRLHAERGDQDARGAVRRAAAARRAGLRADPLGGARRPRRSARTAGRSRRCPARVAEVGDLWAGLQEDRQVLPPRSRPPRSDGKTRNGDAGLGCCPDPAREPTMPTATRASRPDATGPADGHAPSLRDLVGPSAPPRPGNVPGVPLRRLRHAQADPAPRGRRPRHGGLLERHHQLLRSRGPSSRPSHHLATRATVRAATQPPATPYDGVTYQDPGRQPVRARRTATASRRSRSTWTPRRTPSPSATSTTATCPIPPPSASRSSSTPSSRTTPRPTDGTFAIIERRRPEPVPGRPTRCCCASA